MKMQSRVYENEPITNCTSRKQYVIIGILGVLLFIFSVIALVLSSRLRFELSNESNLLNENILIASRELNKKIENYSNTLNKTKSELRHQSKDLQRGYLELSDGWISPFNGFKYKLTPNKQSWIQSRTICQGMGGDLAVYGVKTIGDRTKIQNGLKLVRDTYAWIGLTYSTEQTLWRWIQGHGANYASNDSILWHRGQPNTDYSRYACVYAGLYYEPLSFNKLCTRREQGLCEVPM